MATLEETFVEEAFDVLDSALSAKIETGGIDPILCVTMMIAQLSVTLAELREVEKLR